MYDTVPQRTSSRQREKKARLDSELSASQEAETTSKQTLNKEMPSSSTNSQEPQTSEVGNEASAKTKDLLANVSPNLVHQVISQKVQVKPVGTYITVPLTVKSSDMPMWNWNCLLLSMLLFLYLFIKRKKHFLNKFFVIIFWWFKILSDYFCFVSKCLDHFQHELVFCFFFKLMSDEIWTCVPYPWNWEDINLAMETNRQVKITSHYTATSFLRLVIIHSFRQLDPQLNS